VAAARARLSVLLANWKRRSAREALQLLLGPGNRLADGLAVEQPGEHQRHDASVIDLDCDLGRRWGTGDIPLGMM